MSAHSHVRHGRSWSNQRTHWASSRGGARRLVHYVLVGTGLALAGVGPLDVAFELDNEGILGRYGPLHEIADGDNAHKRTIFYHRQVTHSFFGHGLQAVGYRVVFIDSHKRAGHNGAHVDFVRGLSFEDDIAGVITLGNDAYESTPLYDRQCAHVTFRHFFNGIEDGGVWTDGVEFGALI